MTYLIGDDSPLSRMLIARNAAVLVLYGLRDLAGGFDREGVSGMIRQALVRVYRAFDASPSSDVRPQALSQAAALLGEAHTILLGSMAERSPQIDWAGDILLDAQSHARAASEAFALAQREPSGPSSVGGKAVLPRGTPFRGAAGQPSLYALNRDALFPHIQLDRVEPKRGSVAASPNAEGLQCVKQGREAIDDLAFVGGEWHRIGTRSWLDQGPLEQRLLDRLDQLTALGADGLGAAVLRHAEWPRPDVDRAFALAFALGCVDGVDAIDAIVGTVRQSAPEAFPGFIAGLVLATNPNVDDAMRFLLGVSDVNLVRLATDVLGQRSSLTVDDAERAMDSGDAWVLWLVAKSLGTNLSQAQAVSRLEQFFARAEMGSELHLAAIESALRRCMPQARQELRRLLARPGQGGSRAAAWLGLSGDASDLELLVRVAQAEPGAWSFEGLGRLGHVGAVPHLLHVLDTQDAGLAPLAAKELERITGAGLLEDTDDRSVSVAGKKGCRLTTSAARWRNWERANAQRFEPSKKYRAGRPFVLPSLLAELESLDLCPDERDRTALEFRVVTAKNFGFHARDWVTGQQRCLSEMGEYCARHGIEAGSWCFAGAGITAQPEAEPARRQIEVGAHVPAQCGAMPAFAPPLSPVVSAASPVGAPEQDRPSWAEGLPTRPNPAQQRTPPPAQSPSPVRPSSPQVASAEVPPAAFAMVPAVVSVLPAPRAPAVAPVAAAGLPGAAPAPPAPAFAPPAATSQPAWAARSPGPPAAVAPPAPVAAPPAPVAASVQRAPMAMPAPAPVAAPVQRAPMAMPAPAPVAAPVQRAPMAMPAPATSQPAWAAGNSGSAPVAVPPAPVAAPVQRAPTAMPAPATGQPAWAGRNSGSAPVAAYPAPVAGSPASVAAHHPAPVAAYPAPVAGSPASVAVPPAPVAGPVLNQPAAKPPATFFDLKVPDNIPGLKPLKKLPWEK